MKIKLIKAMGIFMTAGMLAGTVNPATVGAGKLTGSDSIDMEKSVEEENASEAAEVFSESASGEEKKAEGGDGKHSAAGETAEPEASSSSGHEGISGSESDAASQPDLSSTPDPEETVKPDISSSPQPAETMSPGTASPGPDETVRPGTASPRPDETVRPGTASPRPDETVKPGTASPRPDETVKPGTASPRPDETIKPDTSQSPGPGETAEPAPSIVPTLSPSPGPSVSPGPDGEEYYYEPVTGVMVKGPRVLSDGKKVFYDTETGKLVRGDYEINGVVYHFDETDGHLMEGQDSTSFWLTIDGSIYRYENWERQGWHPEDPDYRGEELYDPETGEWYWLDGLNQGRIAVNMDVYIESEADAEGNIGKWVRYNENGHMIRGWSEDGMYYFDPAYGTMAKGKVLIDGIEYEFDKLTGQIILQRGFEEYGIQCNAEPGVEYDYVTCAYADENTTVRGKAMFDYTTFEADDTHEMKEGYEWKRVVVTVEFDGWTAATIGCRASILYDLDYYTFSNRPLNKVSDHDVAERKQTIRMQDEDFEITTRYGEPQRFLGDDEKVRITFVYECHVPAGYDGITVALCNASNQHNGERELDRIDEDSLIFRLK